MSDKVQYGTPSIDLAWARKAVAPGPNSFANVTKTTEGICASGKTYAPVPHEIIADTGDLALGTYDCWIELSAQDKEAIGHYLEFCIVDKDNNVKKSLCIINANHGRGPRMPYLAIEEEGDRLVFAAGDIPGEPNSVYAGTINVSRR